MRSPGLLLVVVALMGVVFAWFLTRGNRMAAHQTRAVEAEIVRAEKAIEERAAVAAANEERKAAGSDAKPATPSEKRAEAEQPDSKIDASLADRATLAITVTDQESHEPISDARIGLWEPRGGDYEHATSWSLAGDGRRVRTDELGRGSLDVPANVPLKLQVVRAKQRSSGAVDVDVARLSVGERRDLRVELPTPHEIIFWGKVVSADTGSPLPGAQVRVYDGSEHDEHGRFVPSDPLRTIAADSAGMFEVRSPSWERQWLRVDAPPCASKVLRIVEGFGTAGHPCEIRLSAGASVRARIFGSGNSPQPHATVKLWVESYEMALRSDDGIYTDIEWRSTTDERGECTLRGLPCSVQVRVEIEAPQFVRIAEPLMLTAGEERLWEYSIGSGGTIKGRVRDQSDEPVAGLLIWLMPNSERIFGGADGALFRSTDDTRVVGHATTDGSGSFKIEDVAPGDYRVGPAEKQPVGVPRRPIAPLGVPVTLPAGRVETEVAITAYRGLFVKGRVLDAKGVGVPGVFVDGSSARYGNVDGEESEAGGQFVLGPLPPGEWQLNAAFVKEGNAPGDSITAIAGGPEVTLRLAVGGSVTGRVLDASGHPVRAEVTLMPSASDVLAGWTQTTTDEATGVFTFEGVKLGSYFVVASREEGTIGLATDIRVEADRTASDLELRLAPAAKLSVRFEPAGVAAQITVIHQGHLVRLDGVDPTKGVAGPMIVPAGKLKVRATTWSGTPPNWVTKNAETEVELKAGETREIVMKAP